VIKPKPAPESLSFEQALQALEDISQKIEAGEIGLEDSIAEYEHGMALIKRCREVLAKAQQRVDELQRTDA
jgi:exodeoxyribonuclease VII small subunit